jgi:L-asparagine transporter-like permease
MTIAIGLATIVYVAVALGVFGTLTVAEVIEAGPTAIAVAAQPVLGDAGYWLMTITALFATAGATNAGLYPATGLSEELAATGQFPPVMGHRVRETLPVGLLVASVLIVILVVGHDLSAIASIGSAVALGIFALVTIGHLRIYRHTGARLSILIIAIATVLISLITFVFTTLIQEPASIVTLAIILVVSVILDVGWSRPRPEPVTEPA